MCLSCLPVAGTVEEMSPLAAEKSGLKQGDRVMALVGGGGYAGMYRDSTMALVGERRVGRYVGTQRWPWLGRGGSSS